MRKKTLARQPLQHADGFCSDTSAEANLSGLRYFEKHPFMVYFSFTHKDTALYTNLFSIPTHLFGGLRLANNFLHEQTSLLYFADLRNVANDGICTDAYFICLWQVTLPFFLLSLSPFIPINLLYFPPSQELIHLVS